MKSPLIKCTISPIARLMLSSQKKAYRRDTKLEFLSGSIEAEHPHVDEHILKAIYRLNPMFQVEWELQPSFESRWHIKGYRTESKTDEAYSILLLQHPEFVGFYQSGEYVPLDGRAVKRLEKIIHWNKNPLKFIRDFQAEQDEEERKRKAQEIAEMDAWARYHRRAFMRFRHNPSDPGWETGVSFNKEKGIYEASSSGAHGRTLVRAI